MPWGWSNKQLQTSSVAFLGALALGLVVSFGLERALERGRVAAGFTFEGRSVSGLTRSDVERVISARAAQLSQATLLLRLEGQTLSVSGSDLGFAVDVPGSSTKALAEGKTGNWIAQFSGWFGRLLSAQEIELWATVDRKRLSDAVSPWATQVLPPPGPPTLTYTKRVELSPGRPGTVVLMDRLAQQVREAILLGSSCPAPCGLPIPTSLRPLAVPEEVLVARRQAAEALVSAPINVRAPDGGDVVVLAPDSVGAALSGFVVEGERDFKLSISSMLLRQQLGALLAPREQPAVDAHFTFPQGGDVAITPSATGLALDEAAFVQGLWAASKHPGREVVLAFQSLEPQLTEEQARALAVTGLVSSFTTRHACCQPRVQNIHTAAAALNGVVLRPGQTFSLNKLLGPRTTASGYLTAPTIVRGEMADMLGGGISQLATTLFNAALRGGYEILQRQPHSVYFSRYPEGHEATVSFPEPDLIFRNDTQAGLVIQTEYTPTTIKVLLYGDNGGRVVTVGKSSRYKVVRPPTEYEADDAMPPEKSKRVRAGQLGWTLLVSRTVKEADGTLNEEKREVVYSPRPELVRVHPCLIPKGEKGHTGEECPEPEEELGPEEEEVLSDDVYYETTEVD